MRKNEIISKEYVENELRRYHVPGLGLAVLKEGEALLCTGYGYRNLEQKTPITPKTQFGIASCSKSFTSAIIAMLVDQGYLSYDIPIKEIFPDFQLYDPVASQLCSIQDMLTHRTGIAGHDALWTDEIDRAELWKRLKYIQPNVTFRSKTQYSNLMYTIAGHIAEKITGISWDELVYKWIFEPLDMKYSNTSITKMLKAEDYAKPYWQGIEEPYPIDNWNVDLGGPAASINSCLEDMLKWIHFQMSEGEWNGKRIISKDDLNKLHETHVPYHLWPWSYNEMPPVGGYGLGWFTDVYRGKDVVFHYGEIEGYCTLQAFLPKEKIGIVCFVNLHKPCTLILNSIWYTVMDNLLGLTAIDWSERFHNERGKYGFMYEHWDVNLLKKPPSEKTIPSHGIEEYLGCYHNPGYGSIRIVNEGNKLFAYYRNMRQSMEHYHYDTFKVLNIKMDTLLYTIPLTFITNPYSGEIDCFSVPLEPRVDPILFQRVRT